jgi:hypothetical protein
MKVLIQGHYRGYFNNQRIELKTGEYDLDEKLVEFLRRDSPGLISPIVSEVKKIAAPAVDKMMKSPRRK